MSTCRARCGASSTHTWGCSRSSASRRGGSTDDTRKHERIASGRAALSKHTSKTDAQQTARTPGPVQPLAGRTRGGRRRLSADDQRDRTGTLRPVARAGVRTSRVFRPPDRGALRSRLGRGVNRRVRRVRSPNGCFSVGTPPSRPSSPGRFRSCYRQTALLNPSIGDIFPFVYKIQKMRLKSLIRPV